MILVQLICTWAIFAVYVIIETTNFNFLRLSSKTLNEPTRNPYTTKKPQKKLTKLYSVSLKSLLENENEDCRDIASVPRSNTLIFFLSGDALRRYEFGGLPEAPVVYRCASDRHIRSILHMSARSGALPDWNSTIGSGCGSLLMLETVKKDAEAGPCFIVATTWNGLAWQESGRHKMGSEEMTLKIAEAHLVQ